jgi:hypothetical protein
MTPTPDLHAELRATRRELAAAHRALHEHAARRVAVGRPITREDTVRALGVVLQHSTPRALDEARAERDRLARDLAWTQARMRAAQSSYTSLREYVWQISQRTLAGHELPESALEHISAEAEDSEDDNAWEERERRE